MDGLGQRFGLADAGASLHIRDIMTGRLWKTMLKAIERFYGNYTIPVPCAGLLQTQDGIRAERQELLGDGTRNEWTGRNGVDPITVEDLRRNIEARTQMIRRSKALKNLLFSSGHI